MSTLQVGLVEFQNNLFGNGSTYTLTSASSIAHGDQAIVTIDVGTADFDSLVRITDLATSLDDSFLSLGTGALLDMMSLSLVPVVQSVRKYVQDAAPPTLLDFSLDMDNGRLTLTFSETVNIPSLDVTKLTLESDTTSSPRSFTVTSAIYPMTNTTTVTLQLPRADQNSIKFFPRLAVSQDSTFLSAPHSLVSDMSGVSITAFADKRAAKFTPDMTAAAVESFDVNINDSSLTLHFSETVNVSTFQVTQLTLQDHESKPSSSFTLTGLAASVTVNSQSVQVVFTRADRDEIYKLAVCRSRTSCYLTFPTTMVQDMVGNAVDSYPSASALPVANFAADTKKPTREQFVSLDRDTGRLVIRFSETMNASSFNPRAISLESTFSLWQSPFLVVTLSGGSLTSTNDSFILELQLTDTDLDNFKNNTGLCINSLSCWIYYDSSLVDDMAGNSVIGAVRGTIDLSRSAASVIPDQTSPQLTGFTLDLTSERVSLTFDEAVTVSTLKPNNIIFQDTNGTSGRTVQLTGGNPVTTVTSTVMVFTLLGRDLLALQAAENLANSNDDTYIRYSSALVADTSSNQVQPRTDLFALKATAFVSDKNVPSLRGFKSLDMDEGTLTVSFSEPILLSSVNYTRFTLQSQRSAGTTLTLKGGKGASYTSTLPEKTEVQLSLIDTDVRDTKLELSLATQRSDTYLYILQGAVQDMASHPVNAVPSTAALLADIFVADTTNPRLTSYSLDMNIGTLALTFNDVVSPSTFAPTRIKLQARQALNLPFNETYTLTGGSTTSTHGYVIVASLTSTDLNAIKERPIATAINDTFLSLDARTIQDVFNTAVISVTPDQAQQAQAYTADTTAPELREWNISINTGVLHLEFTESVDITTLALDQFKIQNVANMTEKAEHASHPFQMGVPTPSDTGIRIAVRLSVDDLNTLKRLLSIGTNTTNSYLVMSSLAIRDMAGNNVVGLPDTAAKQATDHVPDSTKPILISAKLDLYLSTLCLFFDEVIDASSVNATLITIQNAVSVPATGAYHLLSGGAVSPKSSTNITITLLSSDLNSIISNNNLSTTQENTFVSLGANAAKDMSGNAVLTSSRAVQATLVFDTVAPTLQNFDLDMGLGRLSMTFSKSVDTTSFDFSQIVIQSQKGAGGVSVNISGATVFQSLMLRNVVTLALSGAVLDELKKDVLIATTRLNTFVSLSSSSLKDLAGNGVEAILATNAKGVGTLTPDGVAPTLQTYSLDMDGSGQLLLTFSEAVQGSTLDSSLITLVGTGTQYTLTGGSTTSGNSPTIIVDLTAADLNAIKKNTALATSKSTTSLLFSRDLIRDMAGNVINATTATSLVQFTADTTEPTLTSYSVGLAGTPAALQLTMTFSEVVNASTFDLSQITLISTSSTQASTKSVALSLNTATRSQASNTILTVEILEGDLTQIRANRPLFEFRNTSFLNMTSLSVLDMAGQQLTTVAFKQAAAHTADLTRPKLSAFSLDMNAQELLLTFDENIVKSSLNASHIKLQNAKSSPTASLDLSVSSSGQTIATSGRVIRISLMTSDFNLLSLRTALATSRANTFLSLGSQSIQDNAQNYADEVPTTSAQQTATFTADISQPSLTNWTIDLSFGSMAMTFSEAVRASSFKADELTLHSDASIKPLSSYTLTGAGLATHTDGTVLLFHLTFLDMNAIQARAGLAINLTTAFLSLGAYAVQDMNGNLVQHILTSQAIAASAYTPDTFSPALLSWEINLSKGILALSFNKTINRASLNFSVFEIQDGATNVTNSYALKNTVATGADAVSYSVNIDPADSDQIKQLGLCSSTSNCFALFPTSFAKSISGLPIVGRGSDFALQAEALTVDVSGPSIVSFSKLDMAQGELEISFSEVVNASSFTPSAVTLQTWYANPVSSYTLTGGQSSSTDSPIITLTLSSFDVAKLQDLGDVCTHRGTCYLSATTGLVEDLSGNTNLAFGQGYPGLIVQSFTRDVTAPVLNRFALDVNSNTLSLTFSKPVRSSRLKTSEITLQSAVTSLGGQLEYTLTGGVLPTQDGLRIVTIQLTTVDSNQLKQRSFASSITNTFIRLTANTVTDMSIAPNKVSAIVDGQAKAASAFLPDTTGPILLSFDLSLDANTLMLSFDEPMNWTSFVAHQLIFSSSTLASASTHQLSGGILAGASSSSSNSISLLPLDIGQIKLDPEFGTAIADTFLSFASGTIKDVSGNNNMRVIDRMAATLTFDTTNAELQSYTINVELGTLDLTFTDVVNASTFDATALTLQSRPTAVTGQLVTLTSSSATLSQSGYRIVVTLSPQDLQAITLTSTVARSLSSTFLVMAASAIEDINGLNVVAIVDGRGKPASGHVGIIGKPTTAPPLTIKGEKSAFFCNGFVAQSTNQLSTADGIA